MRAEITAAEVIANARAHALSFRAKADNFDETRFRHAQLIASAEALEALANAFDPPDIAARPNATGPRP